MINKSENALAAVLVPVVNGRPPAALALRDQPVYYLLGALLRQLLVRKQPFTQLLDSHFFAFTREAAEVLLTVGHHLGKKDDFCGVFIKFPQARHHLLPVSTEHWALNPAQDSDELRSQLERHCFNLDSPAWRSGQHVPKINVDDAAVLSKQDVSVVSVFYLEHVADQRIPCQRVCEVLLSFHKVLRLDVPKVLSKVVKQISTSIELLLHRFPDVVDAETVRNELNQAAVVSSGQNLIRSQLYF